MRYAFLGIAECAWSRHVLAAAERLLVPHPGSRFRSPYQPPLLSSLFFSILCSPGNFSPFRFRRVPRRKIAAIEAIQAQA